MLFSFQVCIDGVTGFPHCDVDQEEYLIYEDLNSLEHAKGFAHELAQKRLEELRRGFSSLRVDVFIAQNCRSVWVDQHCAVHLNFEADETNSQPPVLSGMVYIM